LLITLQVVPWGGDGRWPAFNPLKMRSGEVAGSMAWTVTDDAENHTIFVRPGMTRLLFGLARVGHELEHCLDPLFGNDEHHSALHFCGRSFNPVRSWRHLEYATPTLARRLRASGRLEW